MRPRIATILTLCAATMIASAPLAAQQRPALVVLITVDQLPSRYIERFNGQFTGGFRKLIDEGTYIVSALQDHAITATAPGHATLWSGRFPANNGIISNELGVPDPAHPLIGALSGAGASPHRFRGTTAVDWIVGADSATRVLSVSRKDRGAILPVGTSKAPVFWWSNQGGFTTSTYYADTLPAWVQQWNNRVQPAQWAGREWTLSRPEQDYAMPDSAPWEGVSGRRGSVFPHRVRNIADLEQFPWIDSLTLDFARAGLRTLGLGTRGRTDVLAVSLSALDFIGHDFGPDSREVQDHLLRLDRWLGTFLDDLDREFNSRGGVLAVLSSDHGVMPMPEVLTFAGDTAARVQFDAVVREIITPLQQAHDTSFGIATQNGLILADTSALRRRGVDVAQLSRQLAERVRTLRGIMHVHTPQSLAATPDAESAILWRRAIPQRYGWLIAIEPHPNWAFGRTPGGEHGTPALLNRSVPLFFRGPGVRAQRVTRAVRTVDVAPTIAALLRIRPQQVPDGVVITEVTR